jgi:hypothetical protein
MLCHRIIGPAITHPPGALISAPDLELAQRVEELGGGDLTDGTVAEGVEGGLKQPAVLFQGHRRTALSGLLVEQFVGHLAKGIATGGHGNLVQAPLNAGVGVIGQQLAGSIPALARLRQRDSWISAEGERLLFTAEAIGKAPQLAAARANQEIEAGIVGEFVIALARFCLANLSVSEQELVPGLKTCWHTNTGTNTGAD